MIVQEFPDTVPEVVKKITTVAHTLGKIHRVFNASANFAEVGLEFEHLQKGSTILLIQVLRVSGAVQLTFSPWVKSWKGSRMVVPNLAQDEAMAYIRTVFVPVLEEMYPRIASEDEKLAKTGFQSFLETLTRFWKGLTSLFGNLWTVGLWLFFIFLVFFLPHSQAALPVGSPQGQSISACFCQQVLSPDSKMKASDVQFKSCSAKYVCVGNAKASCLLQAERAWSSCEF